jgi:endonuclease/exonuclease/phosphatase family metal-dependent hydrolase
MSAQFILMTYNVHSCVGRDGIASPQRIAEVIAAYGPDIVAVQELDIGLARSGSIDQAEAIAGSLNMDSHFHPSFQIKEGRYGNAVMSRHPSRLVRAGVLPTVSGRRPPEKRGILWTEIMIGNRAVQVVNTHLGLIGRERLSQVNDILGPGWIGNEGCKPPILLCGDFNASSYSPVYKKISQRLRDAHCSINGGRPGCTWPSIFPFRRIDHVFVSSDIKIISTLIPKTAMTRSASDHLPLIVEMQLDGE